MNGPEKPNFLMVGAPKTGTTSIANYLNEHPDIFIPDVMEPFYFLPDILRNTSDKDPTYKAIQKMAHLTPNEYYSLYSGSGVAMKGDATVHYLYNYTQVIPKVLDELGDVPIIIMLRNPVERAFSNYKYQSRGQFHSFEKALELEDQRKKEGFNSLWFYKEVGLYYEPVRAYKKHFSRVFIGLFEEFTADSEQFMKKLYAFLKVDETFTPNTEKVYNETSVPKNKIIHLIYYLMHKYNLNISGMGVGKMVRKYFFGKPKEKINPKTAGYLREFYKKDILKLQELIGKDLSHWYTGNSSGIVNDDILISEFNEEANGFLNERNH